MEKYHPTEVQSCKQGADCCTTMGMNYNHLKMSTMMKSTGTEMAMGMADVVFMKLRYNKKMFDM